jgi:hypothetical protein
MNASPRLSENFKNVLEDRLKVPRARTDEAMQIILSNGFEPPASWSRKLKIIKINNLAALL